MGTVYEAEVRGSKVSELTSAIYCKTKTVSFLEKKTSRLQ